MLSAYELHQAGQDVTLIDRQAMGQESSWAGGGIISPLYPWRYPDQITKLALLSQQLYPTLLDHIFQVSFIDPEYLSSGMLVLGDYDNQDPNSWAIKHGIDMQPVDARQIHQLAPEIAQMFNNGWWFPGVHQLRNPRLIALLKSYLQTTSVTLIENEAVTEILIENDRAIGVKTDSTIYVADKTVIAGGAWTSLLLHNTGINPGIFPVKGQMLLLKGPSASVKHITLSEDRYIIPRKDGRVLVGSTTEDSGFNKDTSEQVKKQLHDYALRTIPLLKSFSIERIWSGLRPGIKSGIPAIGKHPELDNLYINSGHYRNGLVMAPASARLLCEIMLNKPTCLAVSDYTPRDVFHNKN